MTSASGGSVTVYRLRLSKGTRTSHVSDWRLYENREEFERRLLEAMVEAGSRAENRDNKTRWLLEAYRRARGEKSESFGINSVIGAEMLVDGEWVDMEPQLVPPAVTFGATS